MQASTIPWLGYGKRSSSQPQLKVLQRKLLKIKDDVYSFTRKDGGKSNFPFKPPQILTPTAYDPTEDRHHTGYSF